MAELLGAFGVGLLVGVISALTGIGGGVIMVPFLYLAYSGSPFSLTAQTVVAHATSLGVASVTASVGTWRYHRRQAVDWAAGLVYAIPAVITAFITARVVSTLDEATWVRGAFGLMLIASAADMARRAWSHDPEQPETPRTGRPPLLLAVIGALGGILTSALGIGGGLLALPALLYIGRLPVRQVAPTSLMTVLFATLAGVSGYALSPGAPALSGSMTGFVDLRLALPLALGAVCTVPLGVWLNRASRPVTLYVVFAVLLLVLGARLAWQGFGL